MNSDMRGESNACRCKDCKIDFKAYSELNNHNYGTHVNKIKAFIGKGKNWAFKFKR